MNLSQHANLKRSVFAVLTIASLGLFLWRPHPHVLPASKNTEQTEDRSVMPITTDAERIADLFDRSSLPSIPKQAVTPTPPDPIDALRRYRLLGVTQNANSAIALLTLHGESIQVTNGDQIEDFLVTDIESRRVVFTKGELVFSLSLPDSGE